ncbi:aminodeoxychorismate lyase [Candidatus Riesia pediculicola]|uniref:aminodeoxychorismate lyase n=1 Tax=Candidatus Riesia pediculicola TaxID=401619 RepID=UPI0009C2748D|nr:aminodeoxychorismate lyase [Candidatus Riesia pediculicola]ARC54308.1 hypothetical protein AOE57_01760 [Candidatus Riesia pediculicola]
MYWVNGKKDNFVSVDDRSIQFGDGVFTTIRIMKRKPLLIDDHLERLKVSSEQLFISGTNWEMVEKNIRDAASFNCDNFAVIKVILSRGRSERGYSINSLSENSPTLIVSLTKYSKDYKKKRINGIDITFSDIRISRNHKLSKIKHLNRLEQILIKRQSDLYKVDECIVLDTSGNLIGCCSSNIFFRIKNKVYTPDLFYAGIEGIMRKKIIDILYETEYQILYTGNFLRDLFFIDEIIVSNSLMPIFSVNRILLHNKRRAIWKSSSRKLFNFLLPLIL